MATTVKTFREADGTEREFAFGKMNAVDAVKVYYPLLRILPPLFKALGSTLEKAKGALPGGVAPAAPSPPAAGPPGFDVSKMLELLTALTEDDQIAIIVDGVTNRLSAEELVTMMQTVFKSVRVRAPGTDGGQTVDMNVHFNSGLSRTMLLVFAEALKVNFSDFFGAARSGSSPAGAAAA